MWYETEDQLPAFGKYVIAKHNRGTWEDSTDPTNVNTVIVKLVTAPVHGNNLMPYMWDEFGPDSFFGQSITHWMEIPSLLKESIDD